MNNKYKIFKKTDTCPVCGGHKGCKQELATDRILCRGTANNDRYSPIAASGQWTIYLEASKVVNPHKLPTEDRQAYYKQQAELRERKRHLANQERNKLIKIGQRSQEIDKLLSELNLYGKHSNNLKQRGLKTEDIRQGGFRSIRKYQTFVNAYKLPGFINNKYVGETGLICPAKDALGRWVGFQVRSDNVERGKYKWTSHTEQGIKVSAKLYEFNELPMNVVHKTGSPFIGICEGILKPFVAAHRHNASFIGYAGGQFIPKYLLAQLAQLNADKRNPVVVFPDKGTITNAAYVYQLNTKYIQLLQDNGYTVKVADWGQWASKDGALDIDEILDLDKVSFVDVSYFNMCRKDVGSYVEALSFDLEKNTALRIVPNFITSLIKAPKLVAQSSREKLEVIDHGTFAALPYKGLPEFVGRGGSYEFTGTSDKVYRDAIDSGYRVILDISGTGTGKTTSATALELEEKERLFYLTTSSRNPNHPKLETDFSELPARNPGYVYDTEKATPTGRPQRRLPRYGEAPDTVSNCHWMDKFVALRNSNSGVNACNLCTRDHLCRSGTGEGYGYKHQTKVSLRNKRIIANPQGISENMIRNQDVAIVDEYSQSVAWLQETKIKIEDIFDLKQRLISDSNNTDQYKLIPLLNAMSNLLTDDKIGVWGISTQDIVDRLSVIPKEELAEIKPRIQSHIMEYNKQVILANKKEDRYGLETLFTKEWIFLLLDILSGDVVHSSLSVVNGTLNIVVKNHRTIGNLLRFKAAIFQDATGSREDLALRLGVPAHEILVIRKKETVPTNITVHHIVGCGRLGNHRREKAKQRVATLRKILRERHRDIGFIEYKKYAEPGDLTHHADARGSNAFSHKKAVASIGVPCANLGAIHVEYEALTGRRVLLGDAGLQAFINSKIVANIVQETGRLRANRRLTESLHYYLCGDINLNFLRELGFKVVKEDVVNLDIKAGSVQQIARFNLIKAFQRTIDNGIAFKDITQQKVAEQAKLAQNSISYMGKAFNGWDQLKRVMAALLCENSTQFSNQFGEITDTDVYLANTYLPEIFKLNFEEMCTELQGVIIAYGDVKLKQLLDNTPVYALVKFLRKVYDRLPFHYQKRFMAACNDYLSTA